MTEYSVNIPQAVVILIASFLALRWYLSKSSPTNATPGAPGTRAAATRRVNPASIDQVAEMLPQLDRRDIAWDLQGNGGNVAATIERGLSGRGLVRAPPNFQPPATPNAPTATTTARAAPARPAHTHPDLITRYNLSSKISQAAETAEEDQPKKSWSADKNERQANLQRRREEMILKARRKMEEQQKAKAAGVGQ